MLSTCSFCKFKFEESSIQFNRRLKTNGPKMCQECYRISQAESRAKAREKKKNETREEVNVRLAKMYKRQMGTVSTSLLMRRLKLSFHEAFSLSQEINSVS